MPHGPLLSGHHNERTKGNAVAVAEEVETPNDLVAEPAKNLIVVISEELLGAFIPPGHKAALVDTECRVARTVQNILNSTRTAWTIEPH